MLFISKNQSWLEICGSSRQLFSCIGDYYALFHCDNQHKLHSAWCYAEFRNFQCYVECRCTESIITCRNLSLQCWTSSCSLPANRFRPTGSNLFKAATMRLEDASLPFFLSLSLSFLTFFFWKKSKLCFVFLSKLVVAIQNKLGCFSSFEPI